MKDHGTFIKHINSLEALIDQNGNMLFDLNYARRVVDRLFNYCQETIEADAVPRKMENGWLI
jgi:hypothetical protein